MVEVGRHVVPAVWLRDVILVVDVPHGTWTAYIHRWSGEVATICESDLVLEDFGAGDEDMLEYRRSEVAWTRAVVRSPDFLRLPNRFEIREYDMMERFARGLEDPAIREALLQVLRGRHALRSFRKEVRERGIMIPWFAFREQALERFVADWLDANGIAYRRG